jgi:hypothetical protein
MAYLLWLLALLWLTTLPALAFTPTELHDELINNPTGMTCYAANVAAGRDADVAACINAVGEGAPYVVSRGIVTRNTFLGVWADVIDGIATISDSAIKAKWTWRVDKLLVPKETIDYSDPVNAYFFGEMVSDGLNGAGGPLTSDDITARTTRQGSRAEVLWGPGTVVTVLDVSCALRSACR